MADQQDNGVWGGLQSILSQGISAYVDTQIASQVYANNPVPQVQSVYGTTAQGQPATATQAAFMNPVTWGLIAVVGIGLTLFIASRR